MIPVAAGHFPAAPGGRPVIWAATGRLGGHSAPPFDSLNLGIHVGDEPGSVQANRAVLASIVGLQEGDLAVLEAEHGGRVTTVTRPGPLPASDGAITTVPGIGLVALAADCVPVALASTAGTPVIGVAHCGWRGLVAGIVPALVAAMASAGGASIRAVLGPSICARCCPVPAERVTLVRDEASRPAASAATLLEGCIDVAAGIRADLVDRGVEVEQCAGCTAESDALFSFRRDGRTGRQGIIIRL